MSVRSPGERVNPAGNSKRTPSVNAAPPRSSGMPSLMLVTSMYSASGSAGWYMISLMTRVALRVGRRPGVGLFGDQLPCRVVENQRFAKVRQVPPVVPLYEPALPARRARAALAEGDGVGAQKQTAACGDDRARFQCVAYAATDLPTRHIDGRRVVVGEFDVFVILDAAGGVELDLSEADQRRTDLGSRDPRVVGTRPGRENQPRADQHVAAVDGRVETVDGEDVIWTGGDRARARLQCCEV